MQSRVWYIGKTQGTRKTPTGNVPGWFVRVSEHALRSFGGQRKNQTQELRYKVWAKTSPEDLFSLPLVFCPDSILDNAETTIIGLSSPPTQTPTGLHNKIRKPERRKWPRQRAKPTVGTEVHQNTLSRFWSGATPRKSRTRDLWMPWKTRLEN